MIQVSKDETGSSQGASLGFQFSVWPPSVGCERSRPGSTLPCLSLPGVLLPSQPHPPLSLQMNLRLTMRRCGGVTDKEKAKQRRCPRSEIGQIDFRF